MKQKIIKEIIPKEIIPIDEIGFCGSLAYGYSNKKEAIKAIEKITGEKVDVDIDFLRKVRIRKFILNEEDYYYWGNICEHCGAKNNGVWSYLYGD